MTAFELPCTIRLDLPVIVTPRAQRARTRTRSLGFQISVTP